MTTAFGPQGPNYATIRPAPDPKVSAVDTWFKNCSSPGATDGTYPTADFFNVVVANLRQLVEGMGVPLDDRDDFMVLKSVLQFLPIGTATGTANTIAVALSPVPSSWVYLRLFLVKITTTNTDVVTINPNGLGARNAVHNDGATVMAANDLPAGSIALCLNDGVNVQILAVWGGATSSSVSNVNGNCVFQLAGSSAVALRPRNGNRVIVNGVAVALPAGGVSAGLTGVPVNGVASALATGTAYYVSLAVIANVMVLRFWNASLYGHAPDPTAGNQGVEVITSGGIPISTDTLVGMVYIDSSGSFKDTNGARYLLSWFNRKAKKSSTTFTTDRSTASNTLTELHAEIRNFFITWADEFVHAEMFGSVWNSSGSYNSTGVALVSDLGIECSCPATPFYTAGVPCPFWASVDSYNFTEGFPHFATLYGVVQGNTGTWSSTDDYTYAGGGGYRSKVYINITVKG